MILIFCIIKGSSLYPLNLDTYHSTSEINNWLESLDKQYPNIRKRFHGHSHQKRKIFSLRIGGSSSSRIDSLYFLGGHHGNEPISTHVVLGLIDFFRKYAKEEPIAKILSRFKLIFQPLVNPDGYDRRTRANRLGLDINRSYPSPGGRKYGKKAVPLEIRVVQKVMSEENIVGALSFHAGTDAVFWPLGQSPQPTKHESLHKEIARTIALAGSFKRFTKSFDDYPTRGEFIDYAYLKYKAPAFTLEVSTEKQPQKKKKIRSILNNQISATLAFILALKKEDQQTLLANRAAKLLPSTKRSNFKRAVNNTGH